MDSGFRMRPLGKRPQEDGPMRRFRRNPQGSRAGSSRLRAGLRAVVAYVGSHSKMRLLRDASLAFAGLLVLFFTYVWFTLPDITDPKSLTASQSSVIVDRNGTELYRLFNEQDRVFVPGDQIPKTMKQAVVAIEDSRFYDRGCIDWRAIGRAVVKLGKGGGASTLTRQLARNALDLNHENIFSRKLKELILGCQLENHYSKDELLNLYLNWIPLGKNAYGIALASRTYFNKDAKDLTLPESAVLAALPQAPTYFSPYGKHVRTTVSASAYKHILAGKIRTASDLRDSDVIIGLLGARVGTGSTSFYVGGRTDQVLKNMLDQGFITAKQLEDATASLETMSFKQSRENIRAAHFVLWVRSQVAQLLSGGAEEGMIDQGGLKIETTLDWALQQAAEKAVAKDHEAIARVYGAQNIALVAADPHTGEILAYVGNTDYNDEQHGGKVDMARAPRQPGSSFKPIVYASAFEHGAGPATVLFDVPTKVGTDQPQNFDGTYWGLTNARHAIAGSRNIPAIKAFFLAGGEPNVLELATRMGAVTPAAQKRTLHGSGGTAFDYGWPLAIGAAETPLTEMVQAYGTLANGGTETPMFGIKRVLDRRGNILYDGTAKQGSVQVLDPRIAYEVTSMLSDVSARPNTYWQNILSVPGFAAAAKTGTSNKCLSRGESGACKDRKPSDLWTMGYTPNLVAGVWVGNADSSALAEKAESLTVASPIWQDFMVRAQKILKNPKATFDMPPGLVQAQVSKLSGQLPTNCTPIDSRVTDIFLQENAPTQPDPGCSELTVDKVTGLLASDECPVEAQDKGSFFVPSSVLSDRFPQWLSSVQDWAKGEMSKYDPLTKSFSGSSLPIPLAPTEKCSLSLTPGRMDKPTISLTTPSENGTVAYPSFQPQWTVHVGSHIRQIDITVDGKPLGTSVLPPFMMHVRVPKTISKDGTHTLKVTLTDEYYNTASDEVHFTFGIDKTGPSVRLIEPQEGTIFTAGQPLTITANAADAQGIKYVEFYLDDTLLTTKPTAPYTVSYDKASPGTHIVRAVATDLSGNTQSDQVTVTVSE